MASEPRGWKEDASSHHSLLPHDARGALAVMAANVGQRAHFPKEDVRAPMLAGHLSAEALKAFGVSDEVNAELAEYFETITKAMGVIRGGKFKEDEMPGLFAEVTGTIIVDEHGNEDEVENLVQGSDMSIGRFKEMLRLLRGSNNSLRQSLKQGRAATRDQVHDLDALRAELAKAAASVGAAKEALNNRRPMNNLSTAIAALADASASIDLAQSSAADAEHENTQMQGATRTSRADANWQAHRDRWIAAMNQIVGKVNGYRLEDFITDVESTPAAPTPFEMRAKHLTYLQELQHLAVDRQNLYAEDPSVGILDSLLKKLPSALAALYAVLKAVDYEGEMPPWFNSKSMLNTLIGDLLHLEYVFEFAVLNIDNAAAYVEENFDTDMDAQLDWAKKPPYWPLLPDIIKQAATAGYAKGKEKVGEVEVNPSRGIVVVRGWVQE